MSARLTHCDRCGLPSGLTAQPLADSVMHLEACGWHVTRGLFDEPVAIYCDTCTRAMLTRMAKLREVWVES
jgi:hypothetical protein